MTIDYSLTDYGLVSFPVRKITFGISKTTDGVLHVKIVLLQKKFCVKR